MTANSIRTEAQYFGATNAPLEARLLDQAERIEAAAPAVDRLMDLDRSLSDAMLMASRCGEAEIYEGLSALHQTIIERRRRAARVLPRG